MLAYSSWWENGDVAKLDDSKKIVGLFESITSTGGGRNREWNRASKSKSFIYFILFYVFISLFYNLI